jgi:hypothetical protein
MNYDVTLGQGGGWWTEAASPKAWMSVRDADLLEALLHRQAEERRSPVRVLEWGSGRSTLWYPRYLQTLGRAHLWVTVEHDRDFCARALAPHLPTTARVTSLGSPAQDLPPLLARPTDGLWVYTFNGGLVRPDLPDHIADRDVNLDAYVEMPRRIGVSFDIAIIDGRKRRRCLAVAAEVLVAGGYVLLHDAWRNYYQPGMAAYASGRRFGDEWWVGALWETDFRDLLPWHAFERHRSAGPLVPIN